MDLALLPPSPHPLSSFTENQSATFSSSSNPCLDFFFRIVPDTPPSTVLSLLSLSWSHHPLSALKLLFHLRGVRGTGKSIKDAFYTCASWLHQHHPTTLLVNLPLVSKFGYFKDLLEILLREVEGADETKKKKSEKEERCRKKKLAKSRSKEGTSKLRRGRMQLGTHVERGYWARKGRAARLAKEAGVLADRETRIAASLEKGKADSKRAAELRAIRREEMKTRAKKKYLEDPSYARLHDSVARLFAEQLLEDKRALERGKPFEISLAAKWAPSLGSSYDQRTLLYDAIARRLFPRENHAEYDGLEDERYAHLIREKLRKEVLVPLRQALQIPEVYMSANNWGQLPYERVPSVAMTNYVEIFTKHDKPRFLQFLEQANSGKKKVAAGALLPHMIIRDAINNVGKPQGLLAELQWKRMVNDLKEVGSQLGSSLAVCDVSGSMSGTPMEVCIALGLLVADLSEEPWKNHICTFSTNPQLHVVQGESLVDRYKFTLAMHWDMNTDFQKVFDTLLELAKVSDLPPDKMIKRLFVFSDMEFDQASENPWETDYMVITRKYSEAGYGDPPEIVFWNLRDSSSTPVLSDQEGVALVSGFSKNLLKAFLENGPEIASTALEGEEEDDDPLQQSGAKKVKINPLEVMNKAISGELYEQLQVVD